MQINLEEYNSTTYKIIGCALKVHSTLGNGFQEVIYQRALEIEFQNSDLFFEREKTMSILYEGKQIGDRRADFLVEPKVLVELKALTKLEDVHLAQTINSLEAFGLQVALLINFGAKKLEHKRLLNSKTFYHEK